MAEYRCLVIAGAGASRNLGAGDSLMPLMPDWASSLVDAIGSKDGHSLSPSTIGLSSDMDGETFERNLGKFLAFQQEIQFLRPEGLARLGSADGGTDQGFTKWRNRARAKCDGIVKAIHADLFDSFGLRALDPSKAAKAYGALVAGMAGTDGEGKWAFATTNYDLAIESALASLDWSITDGFPNSWADQVLDPEVFASMDWDSPGTPVLHLHGAVNWYRAEGKSIRRYQSSLGYNDSLGTPALLLPDDQKTESSLMGGESLWGAFRRLAVEATHILFLGHSLHDHHVLSVVRETTSRLGASMNIRSGAAFPTHKEMAERGKSLQSLTGRPTGVLPMSFGPDLDLSGSPAEQWLGDAIRPA